MGYIETFSKNKTKQYNSSFRESNALFSPPQAPGTYAVHRQTFGKTSILRIKITIKKQETRKMQVLSRGS